MALDVRFVDDVHTQLVAQIEQPVIVWVVGAPHRVHIVTLHAE